MDIPKEALDAYTHALKAIEDRAISVHSKVAYVLDANVGMDEELYKQALRNVSGAIADKYSKAAARVAARFASVIYEADTGNAAAFDTVDVRASDALWHGIDWNLDREKVLARATILIRSLIRRGARNTMISATHDTGGKWARIPQGDKTCAFCMILASHGFYYRSEETAGGGASRDRFHNDCDCLVIPTWSAHCSVAGYDPEMYEDMYRAAKNKANTTDLNVVTSVMRSMYGVK